LAGLVAIYLRKPVLSTVSGSSTKHFFVATVWRRRSLPFRAALAKAIDLATRWVSRRSVLCLVDGERLYREELQRDGRAAENVMLVGSHQFSVQDVCPRSDSCTGEAITLIYVGRLTHEKGTDVLLDAFRLLAQDSDRYRLWLVGEAWQFDINKELAVRGLDSRVTLHGVVAFGPPLFRLYRAADMLIFPSLHEGVPKVPMEAMSQGLPVIASRASTGGYVTHEASGLVVPDGDIGALRAAAQRLASDGELRRRLIARGLELARENCREQVAERIQAAIRGAIVTRHARAE
jgi:glycosyltransferase involved in cell wall biosynthesis